MSGNASHRRMSYILGSFRGDVVLSNSFSSVSDTNILHDYFNEWGLTVCMPYYFLINYLQKTFCKLRRIPLTKNSSNQELLFYSCVPTLKDSVSGESAKWTTKDLLETDKEGRKKKKVVVYVQCPVCDIAANAVAKDASHYTTHSKVRKVHSWRVVTRSR